MRVSKSTKTAIKLTVDIRPRPASPAQKQAWRRFWQKIISGVKEEGESTDGQSHLD